MPTSGPGSSRPAAAHRRHAARASGGFTLIELLTVIAIIALAAGVVTLALRDGDAAKLDEEGVRLTALLEMARTEARVAGVAVRFVPQTDADAGPEAPAFRFVGLPASRALPTRWLDARTQVQVLGGPTLVLGPDAILPPQRLLLRLGDQRLELASDGLGPFAVAEPAGADGAATR